MTAVEHSIHNGNEPCIMCTVLGHSIPIVISITICVNNSSIRQFDNLIIRLKTTLPCRSSLLEAHLRRPASRNVRGLVNGNRQHLNREPDRSIPEKSLRCGNKIQCIISVYVAQDSLFAADIDVYVCRKVLFRPLLLTEYHIPLGVVIFYFA